MRSWTGAVSETVVVRDLIYSARVYLFLWRIPISKASMCVYLFLRTVSIAVFDWNVDSHMLRNIDCIAKCIFFHWKTRLKFHFKRKAQLTASAHWFKWRLRGNKPLPEPILTKSNDALCMYFNLVDIRISWGSEGERGWRNMTWLAFIRWKFQYVIL